MTLAHLVFAAATTAYIVLAIQFEERDLFASTAAVRGDRRRVPMLLPGRRGLPRPTAAGSPSRSFGGIQGPIASLAGAPAVRLRAG